MLEPEDDETTSFATYFSQLLDYQHRSPGSPRDVLEGNILSSTPQGARRSLGYGSRSGVPPRRATPSPPRRLTELDLMPVPSRESAALFGFLGVTPRRSNRQLPNIEADTRLQVFACKTAPDFCRSFTVHRGMISQDKLIFEENMTLADARELATALPGCVGFTCLSKPAVGRSTLIGFVNEWIIGSGVGHCHRHESGPEAEGAHGQRAETTISVSLDVGAELGIDFQVEAEGTVGKMVHAEGSFTPMDTKETVAVRPGDLLAVEEEHESGWTYVANLSMEPQLKGWVPSWAAPKQRRLRITEVRRGPLQAWNEVNHPWWRVWPGDMITEVNSHKDINAILRELCNARSHGGALKVKVVLQRDAMNSDRQLPGEDEEEDAECSICMENYTDGEQLRVLPCDHRFHPKCVDEWLKRHYQCPLCRACPAIGASS